MRNQKGFTLIELVVVIVILGILAAVAVPKFIDVQVDARISAVNGLAGSIRGAANLAHAQALVDGVDMTDDGSGADETVTMEGATVELVYGYPAVGSDGINNAVNLDGFNDDDTEGTFVLNGGPSDCNVVYAQPENEGDGPTIINNATEENCQ